MDYDDLVRKGLLSRPLVDPNALRKELQQSAITQAASAKLDSDGLWEHLTHARKESEYQERLVARQLRAKAVEDFKKSYIKIRTDNIVLDHQTAIEVTKMIFQEADTLTYEDTQ